MELTVKERLNVRLFVPQQGGMITLKIAKDLFEKLDFTSKEIDFLELKDGANNSVVWSIEKANRMEPFTVEFTKPEVEVLQKQVDELDKKELLTIELYDLAVKIKSL